MFVGIVDPPVFLRYMGLPGHRRTSSDKRRRASHFALKATVLSKDKKSGLAHRMHRIAPGATEYNGIAIHVKGRDRKVQKLLAKTKTKTPKTSPTEESKRKHAHV